jgi:hypothetical protein
MMFAKGTPFLCFCPAFAISWKGIEGTFSQVIDGYLQAPVINPHQITIAYCCHALSKSRT